MTKPTLYGSLYHWLGRDTYAILADIETAEQADRDQAALVAALCPVIDEAEED